MDNMWMIQIYLLIILALISTLPLQFSIGQEDFKSFEQRLNEQLAGNESNQTNPPENPDLVTNSALLDMPRNSTLSQIQASNESISKLYNNSLQNMGISSEKTRQNLSDILSILK